MSDSDRRLASWLENAHDLVQEVSVDGRILYVNRAWREAFGYSPQEVKDLSLLEIIHPSSRSHCEATFHKIITGTKVPRIDAVFKARDGRPIDVEGICHLRIEHGKTVAIQGIFRDVTERKRLEAHLRQAQKMQALGLLAGSVAHNFGNLLTAIQGTLDWMRTDLASQDRLREGMERVSESVLTATAITDQLRRFGRGETDPAVVVDVNVVLRKTADLLERLLPNIRIDTRLTAEPARVRVGEGHIDQVIMNLALNARDAMPGGGKLGIETANAAMPVDPADEAPEAAPAPAVVVTVRDTGSGMDSDTRLHMFEPFFTTKPAGEGTGLGLSTVFGMVKQAGGTIAVESAPGEGTSVTIRLPALTDNGKP